MPLRSAGRLNAFARLTGLLIISDLELLVWFEVFDAAPFLA
jgi:hypothetical protein